MRITNRILLFSCVLALLNLQVLAHETDTTPLKKETNIFYIHMEDKKFEPAKITIKQGQTIIFENHEEKYDRWPETDSPNDFPEFNANGNIKPDQNWGITFGEAGTWKFHDHIYPGAKGTIIVTETSESFVPSTGIAAPEKSFNEKFEDFKEEIKTKLIKLYYKLNPKAEKISLEQISVFAAAEDKEKLKDLLKIYGHKKVMTKLLEESGNGSLQDCHQQAHLVGRESYTLSGKDVFSDVTYDCFSGYLHGAMEAFLREKGTKNVVQNINALCSDFKTNFARFECLHGAGHGIMAYRDYDMPKALKECSLLSDDYAQRSCYGGAFMENIISGQGQSLDPAHETQWISSDPLFPCNAVNKNYEVQYECYQMQTSRMLYLTNYNWDLVVAECLNAPSEMSPICYKSLGRDAAGATLHNAQDILNICGKVSTQNGYYDRCIEGAVNVIIDFHGPSLKNQAINFCNQMPDTIHKDKCLENVQARMLDFK